MRLLGELGGGDARSLAARARHRASPERHAVAQGGRGGRGRRGRRQLLARPIGPGFSPRAKDSTGARPGPAAARETS
eukprot:1811073-Pyramimonas_sp.AAC.1